MRNFVGKPRRKQRQQRHEHPQAAPGEAGHHHLLLALAASTQQPRRDDLKDAHQRQRREKQPHDALVGAELARERRVNRAGRQIEKHRAKTPRRDDARHRKPHILARQAFVVARRHDFIAHGARAKRGKLGKHEGGYANKKQQAAKFACCSPWGHKVKLTHERAASTRARKFNEDSPRVRLQYQA